MKIRNGAVFVALVSGLSMAAPGQDTEKSVKIEDLPVAVSKTVMEQSKGVKIRGLSREVKQGKTYYEAELTVNGHNKDVLMDPFGAIVKIEEEVALNSLPPAVRTGIEKQAGHGKILTVETITKNNAIVAYEAEVESAGKKSEIKVGPDGKPITETGQKHY